MRNEKNVTFEYIIREVTKELFSLFFFMNLQISSYFIFFHEFSKVVFLIFSYGVTNKQ